MVYNCIPTVCSLFTVQTFLKKTLSTLLLCKGVSDENKTVRRSHLIRCPSKLVSIRNNRNQFQHYTKQNVCFGVSIKPKQTDNLLFWFHETKLKQLKQIEFRFETKMFFLLFRGHPTL